MKPLLKKKDERGWGARRRGQGNEGNEKLTIPRRFNTKVKPMTLKKLRWGLGVQNKHKKMREIW